LHFDQEEKPENIASCKKDDFLLYYTLKKKTMLLKLTNATHLGAPVNPFMNQEVHRQ
jgi:predicted transcriptional regulator